mmetsp:Transcript_85592/g.277209  ORF Transcript_85592/g.277209 Transcript_85592/m.277209 type:complete len:224 (-) Transcript_85592:804-1475(-)
MKQRPATCQLVRHEWMAQALTRASLTRNRFLLMSESSLKRATASSSCITAFMNIAWRTKWLAFLDLLELPWACFSTYCMRSWVGILPTFTSSCTCLAKDAIAWNVSHCSARAERRVAFLEDSLRSAIAFSPCWRFLRRSSEYSLHNAATISSRVLAAVTRRAPSSSFLKARCSLRAAGDEHWMTCDDAFLRMMVSSATFLPIFGSEDRGVRGGSSPSTFRTIL